MRTTLPTASRPAAGRRLAGFSDRGINRLQEGKTVEVSIAGVDSYDAVFAHQDGSLSIVHEVPTQMGNLIHHMSGYRWMAISRREDPKPRGGKDCLHEIPGARGRPRLPKDSRVSRHTKELIENAPRGIPG